MYFVLLYFLFKNVQFPDFRPAKIVLRKKYVVAGGTLELTCAIPDQMELQRDKMLMYLCKDGVMAKIGRATRSGDAVFTFQQVTSINSGNYTCVYTTAKRTVHAISAVGYNFIFIQVNGDV